MTSEDKFDLADLLRFTSETNLLDENLDFSKQPQVTEENADLAEAEIEINKFTDSEEEFYLAKHGHNRGFAFSLVKSELDKNDIILWYCVYYCSKRCRYETKTKHERNKLMKIWGVNSILIFKGGRITIKYTFQ
ncbi:7201_t:CDS:2, partial [Gigaspora rosea]